MNHPKVRYFIDWCIIIMFLLISFCTTTTELLWEKFTYIAPLPIFFALCILFLNHISIKNCFQEKEFFFLAAGILLSGINIILVRSNLGAFFTITNFLLVLYLADKINFDKIQLEVIAATSLLVLFYWLFINRETYGGSLSVNPNRISLYIFTHFCILSCCIVYFLSSSPQVPKSIYHIVLLLLIGIVTKRILSLNCRGVLLAIIAWTGTCYILPKRKFTIPLVIGASLLMPVIYVLLWKSGSLDGITILGKRFASGRDRIWYEFFKVFIQYPITGIGSNFDKMIPDLYSKEVHHALLDLLFIHGIPVFLIVLYFMYKRIQEIIIFSSGSVVCAVCLASIYGLLVSGTFENHYIVSPYNVLFMTIFIIAHVSVRNQGIKEK